MKPLKSPTAAPIPSTTRMPNGGIPVRSEPLAVLRHDQPRADHRREAVDRLQREVEAARQQDQRLGDDDEPERGGELRGVREVRRREERRAREDPDDEQHRDRRHQRELADRAEQDAPRATRRTTSTCGRSPRPSRRLESLCRRDQLVPVPRRPRGTRARSCRGGRRARACRCGARRGRRRRAARRSRPGARGRRRRAAPPSTRRRRRPWG